MTPGRAARISAAPGSVRANDTNIPMASRVVTRAEPPAETSGSGTPMTGRRPMTAPMLIIAWPRIQAIAPAAAIRTNWSVERLTIR